MAPPVGSSIVHSPVNLHSIKQHAPSLICHAVSRPEVHKPAIHVQSNFDSGNIEVVELSQQGHMKLRIRPDPWSEAEKTNHMQWFNYRVRGAKGVELKMDLVNAGQCSYPSAWPGYQACASYNIQHWFRVPTCYNDDSGVLSITHTPAYDSVQYAYFAPYTSEQHARLVQRMQTVPGVRLEVLGQTLDGRDLELLRVGEPGEGKRNIWVIARQHPGETQAEYFMEGLLERLTCSHDAVARSLLAGAVFYVIPNMCPDGSYRGHLRTNAAGMNLNRWWERPTAKDSPEVLHALAKMQQTGVDFLLDVHGDEELPYCFVVGNQGIPAWGERLKGLHDSFCDAFKRASPEFQTKFGYPVDEAASGDLSKCSKQVGQRFDCLSLTLEMPFKDCTDLPDPIQGWSPERCAGLGASMLTALLEVLPRLR